QMKILITEFRNEPGLMDQTRQGLLTFSIMTLANDRPQAALAIFTESSDLMAENPMIGRHVVSGALANWAKDDPMGALKWVQENGKKFPELINDQAKGGLIAGAAAQDPKLAFQLLGELYDGFRSESIADIAGAARTEEERTATLAAMREYLSGLSEKGEKTGAIYQGIRTLAFGRGYQDGDFESASRWIESSELSPEELEGATNNIEHAVKLDEAGKWIEWLGDSELPAETSKLRIHDLAAEWTEKDYQAAGKWLAGAADSPAKQSAVSAYAEKVFPYEPDIAVQWAETLPPGKDRNTTFKKLLESMPKESDDEKAAAAAFAEEHGIEKP
ncbi:MAG: hypothetical protein KDN05_24265, partial [Verrucomicrobiae bacterium]|nr:hypothetical protein [Verrucomicrobiae bacterium]